MFINEIEDPKTKISFSYTDNYGNNYSASSNMKVYNSLGENDLEVIGRQLNAFLRQVGFYRPRDYMFMEDVTEDEYYELHNYLDKLRKVDDEDETDE